jgi:subtilase family serine protease
MNSRSTRGSLRSRFRAQRTLRPTIDHLESRALLSTIPMTAQPMFNLGPLVANATPPSGAYTPAQIEQAYGFNSISINGAAGNGSGETIAIVDAYDDPNIQADLNTFDMQFGLPATTVARYNATGGQTYPASDTSGGWELEESLDVEWAHAVAPAAKIILVEAASASDSDLLAAVKYAAAHANVVSMSWGGGEFSGETGDDSDFSQPGVAFVASSGDNGAPISWPAASPNVLSVGGTALTVGAGNSWSSEVGWSGSGGGPSAYELQPSYQQGVVTQTSSARANPDVAYDASPSTGVAVYDSVKYEGTTYGWIQVGGTSAGAPQWSALLAIADQGRAAAGQPPLDSANSREVMNILYNNPTDFHDITSGTSTGSPHYSAGPGYDYVTGLGSPMANLVIGSFDGTTQVSNDSLVLTASTAETAGTSFNVTVSAHNSTGATDTGYLGTIHFASSDVQAGLPANFTFTSAAKGVHLFTLMFETAGTQSLTVTDTASGVSATQSGIMVGPAAPANLAASTISTGQINLSWTGSAGATSYLIQQSLNGNTGWTQVGSSADGTTTFQRTGLSAATTYYYRVVATVGNVDSAYSNVASATTSGIIATTGSIWSNSYVPSENAYNFGSYEVGVKFTASVAGLVTGARFYQQSYMNGYVHVGHLWTSTGTLLATATFTNKSGTGWQQVNFAAPVAIQANAVYIVSFSTGGGYFGTSTGFFTRGGVTNGSLQAISNSVSGGDGVYGRAGAFPNVNGAGMNFWADVAFTPSLSGSSSKRSTSKTSALAASGGSGLSIGQSGVYLVPVSMPSPSAPTRFVNGSTGATSPVLGLLWYRRPIPQAATFSSWLKKTSLA